MGTRVRSSAWRRAMRSLEFDRIEPVRESRVLRLPETKPGGAARRQTSVPRDYVSTGDGQVNSTGCGMDDDDVGICSLFETALPWEVKGGRGVSRSLRDELLNSQHTQGDELVADGEGVVARDSAA